MNDLPSVARTVRIACRSVVLTSVALFWALLLMPGCAAGPTGSGGATTDDNDNGQVAPSTVAADCLGCHTDELLLKAVAREEPSPTDDAGEG